jgi:hypothetical protein
MPVIVLPVPVIETVSDVSALSCFTPHSSPTSEYDVPPEKVMTPSDGYEISSALAIVELVAAAAATISILLMVDFII